MGAAFSKDLKEGWHYVTSGVTHIFDDAVLDTFSVGEKFIGVTSHLFAEADEFALKEFGKISTSILAVLVPDIVEPIVKGFLTDFDKNHLVRKVYRSATLFITTALLVKILSILGVINAFTRIQEIDARKLLKDLPKEINYFELDYRESRNAISRALAEINTKAQVSL